jgi:hypothetical protein
MVLDPERVFFQPLLVIHPIMVVIGTAFVNVGKVLAVNMVGDGMAGGFLRIVCRRHLRFSSRDYSKTHGRSVCDIPCVGGN